jgi:hypothetical protein
MVLVHFIRIDSVVRNTGKHYLNEKKKHWSLIEVETRCVAYHKSNPNGLYHSKYTIQRHEQYKF